MSTNHSFSPTAPRPRRARSADPAGHGRAGRGVEGPQISDSWTRFCPFPEIGPQLGCLMWASPRVGAGPADCLGGGAATWAPPSTRRSSQESDVTSIDVAGRVTGGCRRRITRKVLVDAQARACAVAGAGLRATPRFSGCCPGFKRKIGGFARPTCRKFGGDLPRHRRDVLRLRCEGMGLRATSERRDLVPAAEQAGGARRAATVSGGRGVRTASAGAIAISFVPLPLPPSAVVDDGQINILTPMGGPRRRR